MVEYEEPEDVEDIDMLGKNIHQMSASKPSERWPHYLVTRPDGSYSVLILDMMMKRETGHYVIDYYVPSSLLVTALYYSTPSPCYQINLAMPCVWTSTRPDTLKFL